MSPRRPTRWAWLASTLLLAATALSQEPPHAGSSPRAATSAAASSASSSGPARALPPGHPSVAGDAVPAGPLPSEEPVDDDGEETPLPPGHPQTAAPGHGDAAHGAAPGVFEPPPDTESEDPALPKGTIVAELRDASNETLPGVALSLGILHQSVAKGESREHKAATSDGRGAARFDGLETGSGIAYRLTVVRDGATYAALPFQLSESKGMRVVLHVYPVTRDIQEALVVMQGIVFVEVKDDRIQIEQAFTIFNFGKVTWLPDDVTMKLPENFTALTSQQAMSDQGVDSIAKLGARLRGTFGPGRHEVQFHWQIPYGGEKDVDVDVGLPPHVAVMRAMAGAQSGVRFAVTGFPDAQAKSDNQGQRVLVTEKQIHRDEPWTSIHLRLEGLPTPGPWRFYAAGLAALGVLWGLYYAFASDHRPARKVGAKGRRAQILTDLLDLENARKLGDVGPKTYERARRELIDALALTLDPEEVRATP